MAPPSSAEPIKRCESRAASDEGSYGGMQQQQHRCPLWSPPAILLVPHITSASHYHSQCSMSSRILVARSSTTAAIRLAIIGETIQAPDGEREPFASGTGLSFGYCHRHLPAFLSVLRHENDENKDRATCNINELFVSTHCWAISRHH